MIYGVYIDDLDCHVRQRGKTYASYRTSPSGALVVVRPDGYAGIGAALEDVDDVEAYFSQFLVSS